MFYEVKLDISKSQRPSTYIEQSETNMYQGAKSTPPQVGGQSGQTGLGSWLSYKQNLAEKSYKMLLTAHWNISKGIHILTRYKNVHYLTLIVRIFLVSVSDVMKIFVKM